MRWDDVSGLEGVKAALKEMVVLPARRPDLYQGLRRAPRGMLLYGPSGTGKSMIAKAVATESNATFFSISASSLASKYHGESEQLMKALFSLAKKKQPSFIFIDEIDSILGKRGDGEHEASRRLKTEFLVMFDGATTNGDERIFLMGATNRPQDLDEAVRRRLVKRFYVPLPDANCRYDMLKKLVSKDGVQWDVRDDELREIASTLKDFSGADVRALCHEAALMPLRDLGSEVYHVDSSAVRPVVADDLLLAKASIRPNVSQQQLRELESWTEEFGTRTTSPSPPASRRKRRSSGSQKTHLTLPTYDRRRREATTATPCSEAARTFLPETELRSSTRRGIAAIRSRRRAGHQVEHHRKSLR